MNNNKKTGVIGIIVTIVILTVIVIVTNIKLEKWYYVENIVGIIVIPIQNSLTYLKNKIAGNDQFFVNVDELKEENENLRNKNQELEESVRELEIIKAENNT